MNKAQACFCLLLLAAVTLSGQTPAAPATPAPQYFLIHEEVARPSMVAQYESVTRDLLNAFTEKKADPKVFGMRLYTSPDFHYYYVVPISSWAAMDAFPASWASISQAVGKDRWKDLMLRGNSAMSSYNEYVIMRRDDLSYVPANPRVPVQDRMYAHWSFYYVDAAHTDDIEQVAKDFVALYKSKNLDTGFTVYQVMSGNDLPLYIVSSAGRNAADYWANDERVNAILGNDVRPLQARAASYTRKLEMREGRLRPEMSYPLPATK